LEPDAKAQAIANINLMYTGKGVVPTGVTLDALPGATGGTTAPAAGIINEGVGGGEGGSGN